MKPKIINIQSKKIAKYCKVAALFLSSGTVKAAVVYTDVIPDEVLSVSGNQSFNVDFDKDLSGEVSVRFDRWKPSSIQKLLINVAEVTALKGGTVFGLIGNDVEVLGEGRLVSYSALTWGSGYTSNRDNMLAFAYEYDSYGGVFNGTVSNGLWNDQSSKYVGVCFLIGGNSHFGWIRMSVADSGTSVTIHDYAYETVANASIITGVTLPVDLALFNVKQTSFENLLEWKTYQEKEFSHFELEKSTDRLEFETLSIIDSKGEGPNNYGYIDKAIRNGENYYRLKLVDKDGKYKYSPIESINNTLTQIKLSPNPSREMLYISGYSSNQKLKIFASDGREMDFTQLYVREDFMKLDIQDFPKGVYYVQLDGIMEKFVKF